MSLAEPVPAPPAAVTTRPPEEPKSIDQPGPGSAALRLPPALAQEIANLHPQQRQAVRHQGNLVLVAGPGAGKTRTLVARVGHLLATTSPHRGVAAITYTEAAASEVTSRLRTLGMRPGRRLASRTVHSFCLHHILRPYARFTNVPFADNLTILDDTQTNQLWAHAAFEAGLPVKDKPDPLLTKIRRLMAAGEGLQDYQHQYLEAVRGYEQALINRGGLDFDAMPGRALAVLRASQPARDMLSARFRHLVVDEYQDLNPVLHAVVTELLAAGVQVTAVGDPDQTMYAFQGADIRYLKELHERDDFTTIQLTVNFRSGSTLVAAGRGVLGVDRGYRADPNQEAPGTVTIEEVPGDLDDHAQRAVDVVRQRIATGVPAEDIAVLYPGNRNLLNRLTAALRAADLPCDMERTRKIPSSPLADFVSACAARRLAGPVPGPADPFPPTCGRPTGGITTPPHAPAPRRRPSSAVPTRTVRELAATWHRHRQAVGITLAEETPRSLARELLKVLDAPEREAPEDDAAAFLDHLIAHLNIDHVADLSSDLRDRQAPQALRTAAEDGLTMAELAGGRAPGRIMLTTYHSAKGREFSVVVLPGLVDGLMPFYFATRGLSSRALKEQRHNFYVAVTRAQDEVVLIVGDLFTDPYHGVRHSGRSRFVSDIITHLDNGSG
ncbi:ATP-dependent helicase [Actinomadura miaoliensis]|uniref:DNA 3'-5' helicase n=1 Tax=Actinomadura miaoliensis TaxID=430685 RepID=A0ABP7WZV4_9ACTN